MASLRLSVRYEGVQHHIDLGVPIAQLVLMSPEELYRNTIGPALKRLLGSMDTSSISL